MGDNVEATRILSPLNENHYLKEASFSIELARVMELADIADFKSAATIGVGCGLAWAARSIND